MPLTTQERIDWWNDHAPVGVGSGLETITLQKEITNAQILAFATAVTLVPADSASLIYPLWVAYERPEATPAVTAYAAGGAITVQHSTVPGTLVTGGTMAATLLTGAAPQYAFIPYAQAAAATVPPVAITASYGVALSIVAAANFTTGTGSLWVTLRYIKVPKAHASILLEA
jgi:hypothetical protein